MPRNDTPAPRDTAATGQQRLNRDLLRAAATQLVTAWNAQRANSAGFKLALNRFADWTNEEYAALATGLRRSERSTSVQVRVHVITTKITPVLQK